MNKQICIIILMLTCRICNAQNLVPNPSFEQYSSCPNAEAQIYKAIGWLNFGGTWMAPSTPDYYNACDTDMWNVPNGAAHHIAYDGNAYAALVTFAANVYREYIGIELNQPLVIGQKYYLSLETSMVEFLGMSCPSNKIGMRLSTVAYSWPNPLIPDNFAHVYTDSIINDSINWHLISGSIIADSVYQYLIIGNFFDDAYTDTIRYNSNSYFSYYVIDGVCVSTDSLTCNPPVGINESKNNDVVILFPNPFNGKINITAKTNEQLEVSLYDVTLRKIFNQSFTNSISINTEQLAKGVYLYEVRNKSGVIKKGKVVKD